MCTRPLFAEEVNGHRHQKYPPAVKRLPLLIIFLCFTWLQKISSQNWRMFSAHLSRLVRVVFVSWTPKAWNSLWGAFVEPIVFVCRLQATALVPSLKWTVQNSLNLQEIRMYVIEVLCNSKDERECGILRARLLLGSNKQSWPPLDNQSASLFCLCSSFVQLIDKIITPTEIDITFSKVRPLCGQWLLSFFCFQEQTRRKHPWASQRGGAACPITPYAFLIVHDYSLIISFTHETVCCLGSPILGGQVGGLRDNIHDGSSPPIITDALFQSMSFTS